MTALQYPPFQSRPRLRSSATGRLRDAQTPNERTAAWTKASAAAAVILLAAIFFNSGLAYVNGNVTAMRPLLVMICEGAIVFAALLTIAAYFYEDMARWIVLLAFLVFLAALRGLITGEPDVKFLRDVMLIPIFIMLGMASRGASLTQIFLLIHVAVFAVFLIEVAAPDLYNGLFKIQSYYINTRGNSIDDFYDSTSELYISATRPEERFLPIMDGPRTSSVFLEPVSLGNYCSIAVAFVCSVTKRLGWKTSAFVLVSTFAMLVGCDGRLALVTSVLIIGLSMISGRLPRAGAVVILPAALVAAALITFLSGAQSNNDFAGRIAHTIGLLQRFDFISWFGVSNEFTEPAVDSGIAYLITTQSLIGVTVIWVAVTTLVSNVTAEQRRFTYAIAIYATLNSLVSYSLVTIKTAALLWFIHGALEGANSLRNRVTPGRVQ